MDIAIWVVIIAFAVAAAALAIGLVLSMRKRRSERLRRDFGPEYDRALADGANRSRAEASLEERRRRVAKLRLRPISPNERTRYTGQWEETQAQFVDDPNAALRNAQRLIDSVMGARGFPVGEFDQQAADISVDHPDVVENYRSARAIFESHERDEADTEDLRQAMVHYRTLFRDLVHADGAEQPDTSGAAPSDRRPSGRIDTRHGAPRGR